MKLFVIAFLIALAAADYDPDTTGWRTMDLGNEMSHTLANIAQHPITSQDALALGWTKKGGCVPNLGQLHMPPGGQSKDSPLAAYYTPFGQLAGLQMRLFDQTYNGRVFYEGFIHTGSQINVSFRDGATICSENESPHAIGDRFVINQATINKRIPLFADEVKAANFQAGSCMAKMGQHWMYDLAVAPKMSWRPSNLMPIVPMYYTTGPKTGQLQAFFFTTWKCQNGSGKNWDNVPLVCGLTNGMMCKNYCDDECYDGLMEWNAGDRTATYHVMFNKDPSVVKCAKPASVWQDPIDYAMGRDCPPNTPSPTHY